MYKLSLVYYDVGNEKLSCGALVNRRIRLKPTRSYDEEQRYPVSIRDNIDI